jgi:hypothetical protein
MLQCSMGTTVQQLQLRWLCMSRTTCTGAMCTDVPTVASVYAPLCYALQPVTHTVRASKRSLELER